MELLLTGRPIDAHRAYEVGLVNRLVDKPEDAEEGPRSYIEKRPAVFKGN
jgi:enoyl-CoA hydratase/carnithine racemase